MIKGDTISKVILLCGSPRKNGNTMGILKLCAEEIEKQGVEAEILTLVGQDIRSCIACSKCGASGKCVFNDGVNEIVEKLKDADGFIPAVPVYFGTARGDIMAALQRIGKISRSGDQFLSWMVGGPIAVARRGGQTLTLQEMSMFFIINEMIIPGSTYWNMVFAGEEGSFVNDEEGIQTVKRFSFNVAKLINKIKG